jgi:hypothetical protein
VDLAGVDRLRLKELRFIPQPGTDTAKMCATAEFGDTILATINTIGGWAWTSATQLFGVRHEVSDGVWQCTFLVDDSVFDPAGGAFDSGFDDGYDIGDS